MSYKKRHHRIDDAFSDRFLPRLLLAFLLPLVLFLLIINVLEHGHDFLGLQHSLGPVWKAGTIEYSSERFSQHDKILEIDHIRHAVLLILLIACAEITGTTVYFLGLEPLWKRFLAHKQGHISRYEKCIAALISTITLGSTITIILWLLQNPIKWVDLFLYGFVYKPFYLYFTQSGQSTSISDYAQDLTLLNGSVMAILTAVLAFSALVECGDILGKFLKKKKNKEEKAIQQEYDIPHHYHEIQLLSAYIHAYTHLHTDQCPDHARQQEITALAAKRRLQELTQTMLDHHSPS